MNGSWLRAGCFQFIFGSRYAESTRSKFGVSAYSQINTVVNPSTLPPKHILLEKNYENSHIRIS